MARISEYLVANLPDGAITEEKLQNEAISGAKLKPNSVTDDKLASNYLAANADIDITGIHTHTADIIMNDSVNLRFGTGSHWWLFGDATSMNIQSSNNGAVLNAVGKNNSGVNEPLFTFDPVGAGVLFHAGDQKISTEVTGATVTGTLNATVGIQEAGVSLSTKYLGVSSTAADSVLLNGQAASFYSASTHNHDTAYLGITSKAVDSDKLNGQLASYYSTAAHHHDAAYLAITAQASDSVLLEGLAASAFATAGHDHDLVYLGISATASNASALEGNAASYFATSTHNHNGDYLGVSAKAADSQKLDGIDSTGFSLSGHNHSSSYLGISSTAADSDKLGGISSASFLRSDTLDNMTSGGIIFSDNVRASFGNGSDFQLYHNNAHAYMDVFKGNLYIRDSTTTRYTFDDNGSFTATGNITAYSDLSIKDNLIEIEDALDTVYDWQGWTFDRTDNPKLGRQAGLIAQTVEIDAPELVMTDTETGIKSIAYGQSVAYLVEAIKTLKDEVDYLKLPWYKKLWKAYQEA